MDNYGGDVINAFRLGRADKQARTDRKQQESYNALAGNLFKPGDRNAVLSQMAAINPENTTQFANYFAGQDKLAAEQKKLADQESAKMGLYKVNLVRAAPKGRKLGMIQQIAPEWYQQNLADGTPPTDEEIDGFIDNELPGIYTRAGIAMPQAPQINPLDQSRFDETVRHNKAMEAKQSQGSQDRWTTLSPEEVAVAGLPAGTSAQRDQNGRINVLSKRDTSATLSQKDATTAKMKLNTVALARKQLNDIRQRFGSIKGSASAGAFGQGLLPTEKGQGFDRAVDQMRSTLTALTRVPGVGAMSDYETKLDQAKFPNRRDYESVTEQQINAIDDMLALIENGYTGLLGNGTQQTAPQSQQFQEGQTATGPNGQKIQYRGGQWVPM